MTQQRLNAIVVCHVNKDIVDSLNVSELASDFAKRSDIRRGRFGAFDVYRLAYVLFCVSCATVYAYLSIWMNTVALSGIVRSGVFCLCCQGKINVSTNDHLACTKSDHFE